MPDTKQQLNSLTARDRATVLDAIERRLQHDPTVATRNRKRMRRGWTSAWELRVGSLRVYYDVHEAPSALVTVRAIGVKDRNKVRIGGEEVKHAVLQDVEDTGTD